MKTINCRKTIKALIDGVCSNVYYAQADENASFPYAIFSVEEVSKIDLVPLCELEVNVVGYGRDTSEVENICDALEKQLDHLTINENGVSFTLYFERKNTVNSEDRAIVRRRLVWSFNLYEKEV